MNIDNQIFLFISKDLIFADLFLIEEITHSYFFFQFHFWVLWLRMETYFWGLYAAKFDK